jgi:hypothetical protein
MTEPNDALKEFIQKYSLGLEYNNPKIIYMLLEKIIKKNKERDEKNVQKGKNENGVE